MTSKASIEVFFTCPYSSAVERERFPLGRAADAPALVAAGIDHLSETGADIIVLHAQLRAFFSEKLSVNVSSVDTDLVQTGILDSLALVELLAYIEKEFETEISLGDIGVEDFHSIAKLAEYVYAHSLFLKG